MIIRDCSQCTDLVSRPSHQVYISSNIPIPLRNLIIISTSQSFSSSVLMSPKILCFFLLSLHFFLLPFLQYLMLSLFWLLICSSQLNILSSVIPRKWVLSIEGIISFLSMISISSSFRSLLFLNIMLTVLLGKRSVPSLLLIQIL